MGRNGPSAGLRRRESATAVLRSLAGIRHQVADLSRMLAADRPCPDLLRRISAIRAALRGTERRLLLDHAGRLIEKTLPGERHARTRRKLLELLSSYPSGGVPPATTREPSNSRDRREEPS